MYIHYGIGEKFGTMDSCSHYGGFRNRGSPFSEVPLYMLISCVTHTVYLHVFSSN